MGLIIGAVIGYSIGATAVGQLPDDIDPTKAGAEAAKLATASYIYLFFDLIGDLFIQGLKLIIVPLVMSSIILAVANLTKGMATDWARYGLNCNAIAPGYFDTPLNAALVADPDFTTWLQKRTPAGRWGNVEELVGACVFLSSAASSFVNGHTLYVDGGITASL